MNFDYTLYLVTDRQLMSCDSLTEAVEQAILGGCTMIQLREKELSSLEFYNQAVAVKQVTDKYHIPLIINDRIDIAMAVQAAGVHIGQHDLPAATVRKVIGENMLLGVSASSIAEAIQAQQDGADYMLLEEAYRIRTYRYKAFYSLDRDEGIEREILQKPLNPAEIWEQRQMTELIYKGLSKLPVKQRQRIYAHFFLGMSKADIAKAEGTHKSRITRSIEAGLRSLEKYFKEIL